MVSAQVVQDQLKEIGYSFRYWGRNEIKELRRVLTEGENIKHCVNGHYQGGFAMLVATSYRLLLIDSKPMYLTIEAIWYDKIGQIDFNHRLLSATICISTPNKELEFTTWNNSRLHHILTYSQEKMAEARQGFGNNNLVAQEPVGYIASAPVAAQSYDLEPASQDKDMQVVPLEQLQPHMNFPQMPAASLPDNPYQLTLYRATRLPFMRRRYFTSV